MWASPSIIPIKISLISSGIVIWPLSDEDKRTIPFVERGVLEIMPPDEYIMVSRSCWPYI